MPLFHDLFPEPHRSRHRRTEAIILGVIATIALAAFGCALADMLDVASWVSP